MNFCYGLVDEPTNAWGFIEETDPRRTEDMIYLTREEWQMLLSEQSQGRQIVCYEGKVFTSEPGRYYVDDEHVWHKKTDETFNAEKAAEKQTELVNKLYEIKADKAYKGVIINDLLVFETNQTAITNTVASLALMADDATASWKFYTVTGEPIIQVINKLQLAGIAQFGQAMINACFVVEGQFNEQLKLATIENLIDPEWCDTFIANAKAAMDEVVNTLTVEF